MKKVLSTSLVVALLASAVPAALANEKGNGNGNGKAKTEVTTTVETTTTTDEEQDLETEATTKNKTEVQNFVELKKDLIELRQELKKSTEVSAEQKATYEALVAELEKNQDKKQALEVQMELLERYYDKTDRTSFKKLGVLLEENGTTEITAFVDGKQVKPDVAPFIKGGRALVPVRAISAALKADVKWDAATRTAVITRGEQSITLYLDKQEALVNGTTVKLEIAPVVKNGRVFLPLRFVSEQLNAQVEWQEEGKIVIIDDEQKEEEAATETEEDNDSSADSATDSE